VTTDWVVVTGASRGIGLAVTRRLLADGFGVIGVARSQDRLEAVTTELASGDLFVTHALDLADHEAAAGFWERVRERHHVVGLVNNAGTEVHGPATELTSTDFSALLEVNVVALHVASVEAHRTFAGRGGSIVNLASIDAHRGLAGMAGYCASKAAVLGLTRALAVEWARDGVRVNSVSPGPVHTDMTASAMAEGSKAHSYLVKRTPQRRFGRPEEVASAVGYLMSSDASFITGADLPVDGGFLA
jgi:NAD(P)-dependent dehydrogenase (short-subunit alcohol dehydrogenase family)